MLKRKIEWKPLGKKRGRKPTGRRPFKTLYLRLPPDLASWVLQQAKKVGVTMNGWATAQLHDLMEKAKRKEKMSESPRCDQSPDQP